MPTPNQRPLLIVFNPDQIADQAFRDFVARSGLITYWAQAFPNTIFVSALVDAASMTRAIHDSFPSFQFFVTELTDPYKRDGYMPQGVWDLIYSAERLPEIAS